MSAHEADTTVREASTAPPPAEAAGADADAEQESGEEKPSSAATRMLKQLVLGLGWCRQTYLRSADNLIVFVKSREPALWLIALLVGTAVGGAALIFRYLIGWVQWLWIGTTSEWIMEGVRALPWWTVLAAPIVVVAGVSVNAKQSLNFPPQGFSLAWYVEIFADTGWRNALFASLTLATLSAALAVAIALPLAWFLAMELGWGPNGVFWSVPIAEGVMTVIAIVMFRRGTWKVLSPEQPPPLSPATSGWLRWSTAPCPPASAAGCQSEMQATASCGCGHGWRPLRTPAHCQVQGSAESS